MKHKKKILVVDDDKPLADLLGTIFQNLRVYFVKVIYHPQETIPTLTADPFDLVFLDLKLPGKNGLEITQDIRQHPQIHHTKIILLSNISPDTEILKMAKQLDILDYCVKQDMSVHHLQHIAHFYLH